MDFIRNILFGLIIMYWVNSILMNIKKIFLLGTYDKDSF